MLIKISRLPALIFVTLEFQFPIMKNILVPAAVFSACLFFFSCKKDDVATTPVQTSPATVRLRFNNFVDVQPMVLGPAYRYINTAGDSFSVTTYKYYISNIKLSGSNNLSWSEPESYHLVNQADPNSLSFVLSGMPNGTYTHISFMIGVDSARNVSGAQTGALDPVNDMFWTWNTGYIMAKFEGKSNNSTASAHNITFHIAGYSGPYAAQRIVNSALNSDSIVVASNKAPEIIIAADAEEWFKPPHLIQFATLNNVATTGPNAAMIADNYADMFVVVGVVH